VISGKRSDENQKLPPLPSPLSVDLGFTLLEVLVAVAIVGLTLVGLLRLHLLSLDATLAAQDLTTAVLLAEGKMATFLAQAPRAGEDEGQFDGPDLERFRWTTSVTDHAIALGDQNDGRDDAIGLWHVTVSVHWRDGNRNRSYSLETYESK
jgi:general secretion pathway protein I